MSTIEVVSGRQVLDSRGNPTVEVEIVAETFPTNDIRSVRARRGVS